MCSSIMQPGQADLEQVIRLKYGELAKTGWSPRMRMRFGYFTPDEYYEALVANLITNDTIWLDLGCGRNIFPNNYPLAYTLAKRCKFLVGVDPSKNIEENDLIHEKFRGFIEDFYSQKKFDVVTLRMVAEHITNPEAAVNSLARLIRPGGKVVIYTINKWSPVPILTRLIPFSLHHCIKKYLWNTEEKDTFPVAYHMNTKKQLSTIFKNNGFSELSFLYYDDCKIFYRFRILHFIELSLYGFLKKYGLVYPENCLIAVYKRQEN